ncbi:MAG: hypothetical protein JWO05_2278 [Gemmatimonadetes bacterium]|nr:hypothetical protein [Gemmatimonadota bacterium]
MAPRDRGPAQAALVVALLLGATYAATLAPGVTFWDSGEFIAASRTLGIPHPPGTPLFVLLLAAWARLLGFLPWALATNAFSAACTVMAMSVLAAMLTRATGDRLAGIAGATCAGTMTSVWLNATETEVYAASLALSVLILWSADRAGRNDDDRALVLASYLVALAVPLHLSALVVVPSAVVLASRRDDGWRWRPAALLGGAFVLSLGIARLSLPIVIAGAVMVVVARRKAARVPIDALLSCAIAASALLIMLVRARHDPAVNQGNPATWSALLDVIGRRQYDVAHLWPRQAPAWLQLGNVLQYADWQVALALAPTVIPSVARVAVTVAFMLVGVYGAFVHRQADRGTFIAIASLLACGTLGVAAYLNLKAGASYGWGVLPESAPHEARDRDYFFVLGFVAWGLWIGMGLVAFGRRHVQWPAAGLLLAAVPAILNWRAIDRTHRPEADLPVEAARLMLNEPAPRAVLFVGGDNDSYPLWYAQAVLGIRTDVITVTIPLLGARWYREELERRYRLFRPGEAAQAMGVLDAARRVATQAVKEHRTFYATVLVDRKDRNQIARDWEVSGMTFRGAWSMASDSAAGWLRAPDRHAPLDVERLTVEKSGQRAAQVLGQLRLRNSLDPTSRYFATLLRCPGRAIVLAAGPPPDSLDSTCNFR